MRSADIFDVIEDLAATSSKVGKQSLIASHADDEDFIQVLVAALDPFVTYGMAKVPPRVVEWLDGSTFDGRTWQMLNDMAARSLTGNAARDMVQNCVNTLDYKSAELLARIITKDLRGGFSESTVNKAIPDLITTFDCMLAHKFESARVKKWPQIVEPKLDGVRVLAFVSLEASRVNFFSRSGKEFYTFDHLKEPILNMVRAAKYHFAQIGSHDFEEAMTSVVFDGEIVSGAFNKTVGDVRRKDSQAVDAVFNVFDVLTLEDFNSSGKGGCDQAGSYSTRRALLERIVTYAVKDSPVCIIQKYVVNSEAEIHNIYESVRARGLEGLIVKDPAGLYHRRRNHGWMKIKAEESVDVLVSGRVMGTGKYVDMLGALVVDYNGVQVNVGSGFSDTQRSEFWAEGDNLHGRLIEVEYHEETPDGSLRHPRFVRFRDTLSHGEKE